MSWVYLKSLHPNRLWSLPLASYWGGGEAASEWGLETRVDKKVPGARQAAQESTAISVIYSLEIHFFYFQHHYLISIWFYKTQGKY